MTTKLPRLLREPTGWIMLVLVAGFFYVQWPTHVRDVTEPAYVTQTLDNGFQIRWEQAPELQSEQNPRAWGLNRKGMSFLVQTNTLEQPFADLVNKAAEQDKASVGGAEQEPMVLQDTMASYAFFDAESRIQKHRWYVIGDEWVKVSVLYKPSMESRVQRADDYLASIIIPASQ